MQSFITHSESRETFRLLESWSSWTQRDIDSDKTIVDTVNALIAVAAFIAGVQSQIIAFTMSLHQSGLGNATNAVAFVGLLLDVMGTFLGVVHAMMLQRRIKENTAVLNAMTNLKAILKTHSMSRDRLIEEQLQDIGPEILEEQFRLFEFLQRRFRSPSPFGLALGLSDITIQNVQTVKSLFGFGYTPLVAMGLGVVALVVSTIMFAAASTAFSSVVWVSCVAVLCGVIGLSLLPITYEKAKNMVFPNFTSVVGRGGHLSMQK